MEWGGPPFNPKTGKNRLHFDSPRPVDGDQQAEVDRLVSLGSDPLTAARTRPRWVAMADTDGNRVLRVDAPPLG